MKSNNIIHIRMYLTELSGHRVSTVEKILLILSEPNKTLSEPNRDLSEPNRTCQNLTVVHY